jgi:hypothetical protein
MADLPQGAADDLTITPEARLLRRVPSHQIDKGRPDSRNFNHPAAEETGWSCTLWESDQDFADLMNGHESFGCVRLKAGDFRAEGLQIIRVPEPNNPNHCEVFGAMTSKAQARKLREKAAWVQYPPNVDQDGPAIVETFENPL